MADGDGWDLKFEHIDWVDISDAELSGNQEALEQLMNKSIEIKQQLANSSFSAPPPPQTPVSTTPLTHSTPNEQQPPQSTPKSALEGQVFFPPSSSSANKENMSTSIINASSPGLLTTPNSCRSNMNGSFRVPSASYARAARSSGKRRMGERVGLSPIEIPKKRHPIRDLTITPAPPIVPPSLTSLPPAEEGMDVEMCTPEGERGTGGRMGVQRRLFGGRVLADKTNSPPWHTKGNEDILTDGHRLAQRQKQIEMGKNTIGYESYIATLPKASRRHSDPWTPDKYKKCSTRAWQGQYRLWRKSLHRWDPPSASTVPATSNQFTSEDAALCDINIDFSENPLEV
ncbi:PREDICTED: histone RNA hairpin-binding protein-like [Amphimedon queenslandica]|uniref:Histone RNA hairpin-binding protein RNA-binding domain-containing protein n=1 Tax=Amphimedon queenslandica TaxID=400682 RepID=A0A1X7VLQ5_AMPQE|nr:PREDICTED: histone RNA hairpin-binding protein-like [Amphimedon queenslandica]XP_019864343.1 PREDICTED: histone RNA hairpin-binding protein-like [Amphimedon queenslandica]|eukprot:XP_003383973.1 PREDICTED: histone RNA hairpin-binding protein-like [Amphimedon queenslandica]